MQTDATVCPTVPKKGSGGGKGSGFADLPQHESPGCQFCGWSSQMAGYVPDPGVGQGSHGEEGGTCDPGTLPDIPEPATLGPAALLCPPPSHDALVGIPTFSPFQRDSGDRGSPTRLLQGDLLLG